MTNLREYDVEPLFSDGTHGRWHAYIIAESPIDAVRQIIEDCGGITPKITGAWVADVLDGDWFDVRNNGGVWEVE